MEGIVEDKPGQISYAHVPHCSPGCNEENKKVLFFQPHVLDDQSELHAGEKQY